MLKPYNEYKPIPELWITKIPESWSYRKIKFLFNERSEKGYPNEVLLVASQNMGVVPKDVYGNRTVEAQKNLHLLKLVKVSDFVISLRSFQGGIEYAYYQGIISPAYTVMEPKEEINPGYFRHLAKSRLFIELLQMCVTGIREGQNIDYSKLKNHLIPVPPKEEQNQIVRFLDWKLSKINKLIRAKKKQIALFNEQRQAIINNAVTKGLDSHAKLKESGISGLGSIPSTWSVKPLKYWAKSNLQSLNSSTEADFEFDYLDISSVGFGYVKQEPVHYRFDEAPSRARRVVKYGDTIISTVRTYLRSMCFIDHDIEHCIVSTGFSVLSPIKGTVLPEILSYALSSDYFVNEVIKNSIGVSYPAINNKKLLSLKVALPSTIEEQLQLYNEIKTKTTLLDKGILSIKQQVTTLKEFRTRLISDVVTGKVDVRDIEIPEYEADSDETIDDEIDDNLVLDEEDGEMEVE
ncbi:restriction endonuclease subunit S [Enterococcus cecorum]|uniref:restriction endonuclease subunit S n=1 Tax=Enterococcus cecorum TaxID=44008 RepID=UPI000642FA75|nr:restriction endonuclease subunit S [Enterococcus cecorum]KLO69108.1 hypothetical protein AA987_09385 [Enterococcus cecorum]CAI3299749.1 restriction endonuclease subunit S [Enterococcus cecorum]CAI3332894.1 restriction endonuclease subunit S [Enterococcus cecorum]CAI3349999.1 restriction endonuclease subunit S [Enterococcus cecorum]CAI3443914.1 restriction endonuclease subunit S [Enterococcus cecorum]